MDDETIYRIIFRYPEEQDNAETILNEEGEWYDYGSGDRMMLHQSGLDLLTASDVDYDEV